MKGALMSRSQKKTIRTEVQDPFKSLSLQTADRKEINALGYRVGGLEHNKTRYKCLISKHPLQSKNPLLPTNLEGLESTDITDQKPR